VPLQTFNLILTEQDPTMLAVYVFVVFSNFEVYKNILYYTVCSSSILRESWC